MTELMALTGRHLRTAWRRPAPRLALGAYGLWTALAAWLSREDAGAAGLLVLGSLAALALLVCGLAAGAGSVLPEDRVAGREAWLATLAPAGWQRRLAAVLAGWVLVVLVGVVGGALAGWCGLLAHPTLTLHRSTPMPLPADALLARAAPLSLPLAGGGRELEVEVRPLFRPGVLPADRVTLAWRAGAASGSLQASVRGPLRFTPPAGARSVTLTLDTPHVRLRLVEARWLGAAHGPVGALAWAGLLLGLMAGSAVPLAVLVSRGTTGQTAAAAAFALLVVAVVQPGLSAALAGAQATGSAALAPGVLRTAGALAPPAPLHRVVAECVALRVPGGGASAGLSGVALYSLLAGVLACLPLPRRWREGANA